MDIARFFSSNYINFFLSVVPFTMLGIFYEWEEHTIFILMLISFISLSWQLCWLKDQVSLALMGKEMYKLSGLVHLLFEDLSCLLIAIMIMIRGNYRITQTIVTGTILMRLMIVIGFGNLISGIKNLINGENKIDKKSELANNSYVVSMIMITSVFTFLLPSLFSYSTGQAAESLGIIRLSHWLSIMLLITYLIFSLYNIQHYKKLKNSHDKSNDIGIIFSLVLFVLFSLSLAYISYHFSDHIDNISLSWKLSNTFIGMIMIPFASNLGKILEYIKVSLQENGNHYNAINISLENIYITLFGYPIILIFSWILFDNKSMSLTFKFFEIVVTVLSLFFFEFQLEAKQTNWIIGGMMILFYIACSLTFYLHP